MRAAATVIVTAMAVVAGTGALGAVSAASGETKHVSTPVQHRTTSVTSTDATWTYQRLKAPDRVRVLDGTRTAVATFTVGARTVTLRGAARRLW